MKRVFFPILPIIIASQLFAIAGFGVQLGESMFSVKENFPSMSSNEVQLTNGAFENAYNIGGYLYLDVIPVIDIEVDFSAQANTYEIQFSNIEGTMAPLNFAWASTDIYFTVRHKIVGFNIPFLAKAKLFAGGGYNTHASTPLANEAIIKNLLGGTDENLINGNVDNLSNNLEGFLSNEDNYNTSSGLHVQGGLQFKLLALDSFLFYRHVFIEDLIPDSKGFGSLNLRLGLGF